MMYVGKYNVEYLEKINGYEGVIIDKFSGNTRTKHTRLYFVVDESISLRELLKNEKMLDRFINYKPNSKLMISLNISEMK